VTRSRPEKKSQPSASTERRVLPMQLQVGDRLTDETGDWLGAHAVARGAAWDAPKRTEA